MYDKNLALGILEQLNEAYPDRLELDDLRTRLRGFSQVPEEDWMRALDVLLEEGSIRGVPLRSGWQDTLQTVANIQITQAGRIRLGTISTYLDQPPDTQQLMDALLPLYSRRQFQLDLPAFASQASEQQPLALMMIDVDNFKSINDSLGHPSADRVLLAVAEVVRTSCEHKGNAYRYGGDELAVLLRNYSRAEVGVLAERIRSAISGVTVENGAGTVSVSIGGATHPGSVENHQDLLGAADAALYEAKRGGKNKVCVA